MNCPALIEKKNWKIPISLFIAFHLAAIGLDCIRWHFSFEAPSVFYSYVDCFGLYQNWRMFDQAPRANYYLCALIKKKDGSKLWVEFGHMDKLDYWQRISLRNFRKFQQSFVFNPRYSDLYPDLCRWIISGLSEKDRNGCSEVVLYQRQIDLESGRERRIPFFRHLER